MNCDKIGKKSCENVIFANLVAFYKKNGQKLFLIGLQGNLNGLTDL